MAVAGVTLARRYSGRNQLDLGQRRGVVTTRRDDIADVATVFLPDVGLQRLAGNTTPANRAP
jgi:hypothetical protein